MVLVKKVTKISVLDFSGITKHSSTGSPYRNLWDNWWGHYFFSTKNILGLSTNTILGWVRTEGVYGPHK